jgi:GNAT superfamily N-acetyltransferase
VTQARPTALNTEPTSLEGDPIEVRPILRDELTSVPLRCFPGPEVIDRMFENQGTIGMAAWNDTVCVGQLHCYRLDASTGNWPDWNRPWWLGPVLEGAFDLGRPLWCHACCHVGRTLESAAAEERGMGIQKGIDTRYLGRGIGTALCKASVVWAAKHDYGAVLASGHPDRLYSFAVWCGGLPWTTYEKLGFSVAATEVDGDELPGWAQGDSPPEVMKEVHAALVKGRPAKELQSRLMVLKPGAYSADGR